MREDGEHTYNKVALVANDAGDGGGEEEGEVMTRRRHRQHDADGAKRRGLCLDSVDDVQVT